MAKTSVGVWSRSIADWDLQRETLWEMMERLATYFLLLTLVSLAEADFTVSSKRDMRWVGVLDHLIIFLTPATLPPGGVGSSLSLPLMVSLVQPTSWFSSVSQPSAQPRSSGLEIWRETARYRSSVFHDYYLMFSFKTIQGQNWGSKWAPEQGGARGRNGDRICQIASKELRASNIPNEEFPLGLQVCNTYG